MRYKATFIAGAAIGFIAGTRAGRGVYDKMAGYARQAASHPKVQQATSAAQAKATGIAKSAAAKAPGYAKNAAKNAQAQVSQVPKYASSAKHAAASKLPARFGGSGGTPAATDPAADGTTTATQDDVAPDGNLLYPVDDGSQSVNGIRPTPDTP